MLLPDLEKIRAAMDTVANLIERGGMEFLDTFVSLEVAEKMLTQGIDPIERALRLARKGREGVS